MSYNAYYVHNRAHELTSNVNKCCFGSKINIRSIFTQESYEFHMNELVSGSNKKSYTMMTLYCYLGEYNRYTGNPVFVGTSVNLISGKYDFAPLSISKKMIHIQKDKNVSKVKKNCLRL